MVTKLTCGSQFSMALTAIAQVYTWGSGPCLGQVLPCRLLMTVSVCVVFLLLFLVFIPYDVDQSTTLNLFLVTSSSELIFLEKV